MASLPDDSDAPAEEQLTYRLSPGMAEAFSAGNFVGFLSWHPDGTIAFVSVNARFRRRGIATALFRLASSQLQLRHSPRLTSEGKLWSDALGDSNASEGAVHPH
jgi:ribosomal protein S18 acetylase RimI-like enzyme